MGFRGTFAVSLVAFVAAGCGSALDVQTALQVTQVSSGWFDAGLEGFKNEPVWGKKFSKN